MVRKICEDFGREHPEKDGKPRDVLQSVTTFIGGGGPRFWFSVVPELQQLNYAQVIIQVKDKHDTAHLITPLQAALSAGVPGARVDVRQLETGKPVGVPVSIRLSGGQVDELRRLAEEVKDIFRADPKADRIRDDWGAESFSVKLQIDSDRANLAGITNLDVALSSASAHERLSRRHVARRQGTDPDRDPPAHQERAQLSDIENLYVYSSQGTQKVPLASISSVGYRHGDGEDSAPQPVPHHHRILLPESRSAAVRGHGNGASGHPAICRTPAHPATELEIGGEEEEQVKGFQELAVVMGISVVMIYLALVFQFQSAVKPLIVFAAIPYGMVGALAALDIMGTPFGFMAFLGVASLVGVIVSHVIVLFDFIEERTPTGRHCAKPCSTPASCGLRPVMITVGATVFGLFPLAAHGGPLWEPMCYAQIGGLAVATFITLLLVPVIYAIFVLDLKLVKWRTV